MSRSSRAAGDDRRPGPDRGVPEPYAARAACYTEQSEAYDRVLDETAALHRLSRGAQAQPVEVRNALARRWSRQVERFSAQAEVHGAAMRAMAQSISEAAAAYRERF